MEKIYKAYKRNEKEKEAASKKTILSTFFASISKLGLAVALLILLSIIANAEDVVVENGNVGIGTTGPAQELEVRGNIRASDGTDYIELNTGGSAVDILSNDHIYINNNANYDLYLLSGTSTGKVGIGTTTPAQKLDVTGQIHATGDICTDAGEGKCLSTGGGSSYWALNGSDIYNTNSGNVEVQKNNEVYLNLKNTESGGRQYALVSAGSLGGIGTGKFSIYDKTAGISRLTIDTNGNVGIGTTAPNAKLESLSTTEQLRLSYDASNNVQFKVGSAGTLDIKPTAGSGNTVFSITRGDGLATLFSLGWNGVATFAAGKLWDYVDSNSISVTPRTSLGNLIFNTGGSEKMRIDSVGNVGIGTTSPTAKLHVNGNAYFQATAAGVFRIGNLAGGNYLSFYDAYAANIFSPTASINTRYIDSSGSSGIIMTDNFGIDASVTTYPALIVEGAASTTSDYLQVRPNSATAGTIFTINSAGNVGIGTASPSEKLEVAGNIKGTQLCIGSDCRSSWPAGGGGGGGWTDGGTNVYLTTGTDNVGIGTASPGYKLEISASTADSNPIARITNTRNDVVSQIQDAISIYSTFNAYKSLAIGTSGVIKQYNPAGDIVNLLSNSGNSYITGGNVGIGTTDPGTHKLKVAGTFNGENGIWTFTLNGGSGGANYIAGPSTWGWRYANPVTIPSVPAGTAFVTLRTQTGHDATCSGFWGRLMWNGVAGPAEMFYYGFPNGYNLFHTQTWIFDNPTAGDVTFGLQHMWQAGASCLTYDSDWDLTVIVFRR